MDYTSENQKKYNFGGQKGLTKYIGYCSRNASRRARFENIYIQLGHLAMTQGSRADINASGLVHFPASWLLRVHQSTFNLIIYVSFEQT